MARRSFVMWLLDRLDADGAREALIGDLIEEMGRGRPRRWMWQQLLVLCGLAAGRRARIAADHAPVAACAPGLLFLGAIWMAPVQHVLASWAVVYFAFGTLSLFGDLIASYTDDWRAMSSSRAQSDPSSTVHSAVP